MTLKIDEKIVKVEIVDDAKELPKPAEPHIRPVRLQGTTYKIKPPTLSAALYITINDHVLPDGSKRPFEIFLNTKDVSQQQWMVLATRLISAIFRLGGEFRFVLEEMKQVYDARGSYFLPGGGGMCGGVVAHIGIILEEHCHGLGIDVGPDITEDVKAQVAVKVEEAKGKGAQAQICDSCGEMAVYLLDNCLTCAACGHSKCG